MGMCSMFKQMPTVESLSYDSKESSKRSARAKDINVSLKTILYPATCWEKNLLKCFLRYQNERTTLHFSIVLFN